MAGLGATECFRCIKPVDIGPVLSIMDRLPFFSVNQNAAEKYACDVVVKSQFTRELHDLLADLDLGGELARAVLRRLEPRKGIPPHTDKWMPAESKWRRFQVPLVTHPEIKMRWPEDHIEAHLAPGYLYEVRFDRLHEVVNQTDVQRTHLQVDQVGATI